MTKNSTGYCDPTMEASKPQANGTIFASNHDGLLWLLCDAFRCVFVCLFLYKKKEKKTKQMFLS
jgi:hypothetical protein